MKKYFKSVILFGILILSFCVMPHFASALGGPTDPGDPGDDPDAPIDGGVGLLVAAGVAYGVKKIKEDRKNKLNNLP